MILQEGDPVTQPLVLLLQLPVLSHHEPQLAVGSFRLSELPLKSPLHVVDICPEDILKITLETSTRSQRSLF